MQLTKYTHACVALTKDDRKLVLDPGAFSELDAALDAADAILVTHEHADHLDVERVRAALTADDTLTLHGPGVVTAQFAEFGERVVTVGAGRCFDVEGFSLQTFGGQHAVIHPRIPVIANVGYLVEGTVYHPGDSFVVPEAPVPTTLLVPFSAPWCKLSEVVDFTVAVRAARAVPIHEAIYSATGQGVGNNIVSGLIAGFGIDWEPVDPGTAIEV